MASGNATKCYVCDLDFNTKIALNEHLEFHSLDGMLFSCHICREAFVTDQHRQMHAANHVSDIEIYNSVVSDTKDDDDLQIVSAEVSDVDYDDLENVCTDISVTDGDEIAVHKDLRDTDDAIQIVYTEMSMSSSKNKKRKRSSSPNPFYLELPTARGSTSPLSFNTAAQFVDQACEPLSKHWLLLMLYLNYGNILS